MKVRNKGKVYPSPSPHPSLQYTDTFSVLNLLPAAILALLTVLSIQDTEVLAYMITRSLKSVDDEKKKKNKLISSTAGIHKAPLFDCECFDCYISYWFRWDSSPNRELIHKAIEAFEEHLNTNSNKFTTRAKRKDKTARRDSESPPLPPPPPIETILPEKSPPPSPQPAQEDDEEEDVEAVVEVEAAFVAPANNERGLARKVLPDVWGLFNSRLWNLLSPNA